MAKKRNNYWENLFNNMDSIYDEQGNYRTWENLGLGSEEEYNKFIAEADKAMNLGYGSFNYNNKDYTIYKKKDNKIIKPWENSYHSTVESGEDGLPKYYSDRSEYAYHKYLDPNTKATFKEPKVSVPLDLLPEKISATNSKLTTETSTEKSPSFYNQLLSENINNAYTGITGRNSNYKNWMNGVSLNFNYGQVTLPKNSFWTSNDVFNSINKYFGNLPGRLGISGTPYAEGVRSMKNTAQFIANHPELMNDRRAKSVDYLAMEAKRLGRNIGGYDNLKYTDLLNMFSPKNYSQYSNLFSEGRYGNNYTDFYKRLYNLSASRNGMQGGELLDLFGDNWRNVLGQIINTLGIPSNLNGGILKMLFI